MNGFTIRGTAGTLRYGYHLAATLRAWEWRGGRLRATLTPRQQFYLTRRPLALELTLGRQTYHWPDVAVEIAGEILVIQALGSPEEQTWHAIGSSSRGSSAST